MFNLNYLYQSNVDIHFRSLLLNTGKTILEIFLCYNRFPVIVELDSFFEQILKLLNLIDEIIFV